MDAYTVSNPNDMIAAKCAMMRKVAHPNAYEVLSDEEGGWVEIRDTTEDREEQFHEEQFREDAFWEANLAEKWYPEDLTAFFREFNSPARRANPFGGHRSVSRLIEYIGSAEDSDSTVSDVSSVSDSDDEDRRSYLSYGTDELDIPSDREDDGADYPEYCMNERYARYENPDQPPHCDMCEYQKGDCVFCNNIKDEKPDFDIVEWGDSQAKDHKLAKMCPQDHSNMNVLNTNTKVGKPLSALEKRPWERRLTDNYYVKEATGIANDNPITNSYTGRSLRKTDGHAVASGKKLTIIRYRNPTFHGHKNSYYKDRYMHYRGRTPTWALDIRKYRRQFAHRTDKATYEKFEDDDDQYFDDDMDEYYQSLADSYEYDMDMLCYCCVCLGYE